MKRLPLIFLSLAALNCTAAEPEHSVVGAGVTPPRLVKKVEPSYSYDARQAGIQATVVVRLIVNDKGRPEQISVISPAGFGLDEHAVEAVEQWRFERGRKNGEPVNTVAHIEVNFRFQNTPFDEKLESRRSKFNMAIALLNRRDTPSKARLGAIKDIEEPARANYIPAEFLVGMWKTAGEHVEKDPAGGLKLIQKAAGKKHAPALAEMARRYLDADGVPGDVAKGVEMLQQASLMGSVAAQLEMARRYESGSGVAVDLDRSRRQYRLCAARGLPQCQFRLAQLLLSAANGALDRLEAVAWLQLAAEQGQAPAIALAAQENAKLSPQEHRQVTLLRGQLVRK